MAGEQGTVEVGPEQLAKVLRCDLRTIAKLAKKKVIVRTRHGHYALFDSIGNYVEHLRTIAAGHGTLDQAVDSQKANADLKMAQRRLVEMRLRQLQSEVLPLADIEELWSDLIKSVRQLFMAVPSRARFDLPHLTGEDQEALMRLCNDMLKEVAITGAPRLPKQKKRGAGKAHEDDEASIAA